MMMVENDDACCDSFFDLYRGIASVTAALFKITLTYVEEETF